MYKVKEFKEVETGVFFWYLNRLYYKDSATSVSLAKFRNDSFCSGANSIDFDGSTVVIILEV